MKRREFIGALAATGMLADSTLRRALAQDGATKIHKGHEVCHATYLSVEDAMQAPPEVFAFVPAILVGSKADHPDYMATIDVDPKSKSYGQVVGRFSLPAPGDELHHYGWNACGSCHGKRQRRYLLVPGLKSGNIYFLDAIDPKQLKLHQTISAAEIAKKTNCRRHIPSTAERTE